MDPVSSFWVLSAAGACLFVACGYLFARAARRDGDSPTERDLARTLDELTVAQSVIAKRDRELVEAEISRGDLEGRLARAEEQAKQAVDLAAELRAAKEAAEARAAEHAGGPEARSAAESHKRELALVRRSMESERKAAQELRRRVDALTKELEEQKEERSRLLADLETLSTRSAAAVASLRAQLASVEKQRDATTAVLAPMGEGARASGIIDVGSALGEHGLPTERAVGDHFQNVVDRIARLDAVQSVAITDELGFVVAGSGEHVDALAAFGAFITDARTKAEALVPFREACEVAVRSRDGSVLVTRALDTPDLSIVLLADAGARKPSSTSNGRRHG